MKTFILSFMVVALATCNSQQSKKKVDTERDCSFLNDKYVESVMAERKDSAVYYIDKAILCDPQDNFFKFEKIKLLMNYDDFEGAKNAAKKMANAKSPTFEMLYGTILLKQNDVGADAVLKKAHESLISDTKNYSEDNSNLHFYRIGLDNYFKGKEYSLEKIDEFKANYSDKDKLGLANHIYDLINKETKEDVLYKIFNLD